ncbi:MAG: hypothetical protein HY225_01730 [Candidatus Vogelbacteria bacterium]|nr:hypothetical protein [Candidatus Vogelbacteria bacterium]
MKQYEVVVDDGTGNEFKVQMSKDKLSRMIAESILQGVLASAEIEGEGVDCVLADGPVVLPEKLLQTKTKAGGQR